MVLSDHRIPYNNIAQCVNYAKCFCIEFDLWSQGLIKSLEPGSGFCGIDAPLVIQLGGLSSTMVVLNTHLWKTMKCIGHRGLIICPISRTICLPQMRSCKVWRFVEMFAGEANVSKACLERSLPGVSCDYIYGGRAMDLTTPAGMAFFFCYNLWNMLRLVVPHSVHSFFSQQNDRYL